MRGVRPAQRMLYETRPVVGSDFEWLYTLRREVYFDVVSTQFGTWDEDKQRKLFEDSWKPEGARAVILEGRCVGMFAVEERTDCIWLAEIQIAPVFQGRGIGTELITELRANARERRLPLRLRVLRENHRARRLYERLGFRQVGDTEHHHVMETA